MRELLSNSGLYSKESSEHVQKLLQKTEVRSPICEVCCTAHLQVPPTLFELYVEEIFSYLRGGIFKR